MLILESLTHPPHSHLKSHEDETPLMSWREVDEFESSAEVDSRTS